MINSRGSSLNDKDEGVRARAAPTICQVIYREFVISRGRGDGAAKARARSEVVYPSCTVMVSRASSNGRARAREGQERISSRAIFLINDPITRAAGRPGRPIKTAPLKYLIYHSNVKLDIYW